MKAGTKASPWACRATSGPRTPPRGSRLARTGSPNPFTGFKSDAYTKLVQSASAELDQARRKGLYSQINDLILDECFTMAVTSFLQAWAASLKVHDIGRYPIGGGLYMTNTWIG